MDNFLINLVFEILFAFIIWALYIYTLQNTIKKVEVRNRRINPKQMDLLLIPVFNIFWIFIVVIRLSNSLKTEFKDQKLQSNDQFGIGIGISLGILLSLEFLLRSFELITMTETVSPFPLAILICFIVHWVKISKYKKILSQKSAIDTGPDIFTDNNKSADPYKSADNFDSEALINFEQANNSSNYLTKGSSKSELSEKIRPLNYKSTSAEKSKLIKPKSEETRRKLTKVEIAISSLIVGVLFFLLFGLLLIHSSGIMGYEYSEYNNFSSNEPLNIYHAHNWSDRVNKFNFTSAFLGFSISAGLSYAVLHKLQRSMNKHLESLIWSLLIGLFSILVVGYGFGTYDVEYGLFHYNYLFGVPIFFVSSGIFFIIFNRRVEKSDSLKDLKQITNLLGLNKIKLNHNQIIVLSIVFGTLCFLSFGSIFKTLDVGERKGKFDDSFVFNYMIAFVSFLISSGITYLLLSSKIKNNK